MKNTHLIERLLKNTSRGLFLLAGLGTLYIAFPIIEGYSEMPALSKNVYATNSALIQKYGLTSQDFHSKPLLTSALLHLEAADSVLQSGRSFNYQFSNSWTMSDAAVRLFTTPAVGTMGLVYASCDGASRSVFGMAAQAHQGYTAKDAIAYDEASTKATSPGALKGGVNLTEHKDKFGLLEVAAMPWWQAPKLSAVSAGADKKAELLKAFPGIGLDCSVASKTTASLAALTAELPELAQLGTWQESKAALPEKMALPSLGVASVQLKSAPDGMAGPQLTLVSYGKTEQDGKQLKAAYDKALALFSSKAPLKSLHSGHQDGKQNVRAEFALKDGTAIIGWDSGTEPGFKIVFQPSLPDKAAKSKS